MTPNGSLFFDEWQACLRAHYMHVIRTQDTITESTLRGVLLATGLSEDELEALRQEALSEAGVAGEVAEEAVSEPSPQAIEALEPDEDALPEDIALGEAALEDELEPVDAAELGTDLAPVVPEALEDELPLDDAADDDGATDEAATDEPEPYTPAPGQLSLF